MESLLPGLESAPNIHPMLVHFPVAFWLAGTVAWGVALVRGDDTAWRFGLWLQTLGLLGAAAATVAGFVAADALGHESAGHDLVHDHRDFMLVATGLSTALVALAWWKKDAGRPWRLALAMTSLVLAVVMMLGADRGAALVYGQGVGVRVTPTAHAMDHGHEPADDGHDHAH